jgi:DNA repair protein RecN (Recombination protein N)
MIDHLHIKNVALIEEADIQFHDGLNILSGETGSGKSILIDSITFLLGERPGKDFLRSGAEQGLVEGLIIVGDPRNRLALKEMGVELDEEGQLFLARTMTDQGRTICKLNGRSLSINMLRAISSLLVDVHGQHEHQSLLNPARHIELLDQFCGESVGKGKESLAVILKNYRDIIKQSKSIAGSARDREARMELLQFTVDEIKSAGLKPDEEEMLLKRRMVLNASEKIYSNANEALALLKGAEDASGSSALEAIARSAALLNEISQLDSGQSALALQLEEIMDMLSDTLKDLQRYAEGIQDDPKAIEETEERLDLIYRLKKKYGGGIKEILDHYAKALAELDFIKGSEERLVKLNQEKKKQASLMMSLSNQISAERKAQASSIQSEIEAVLKDLGMKSARFEIQIERKNEFGPDGFDKVEFLISPNPGEPLKPLAKIASGGEMSRIMLALKTIMADADSIETFIFDEIDSGVSGRTAQQVAEKLSFISKGHQILCITHLPQIAAMADSHYLIEKRSDEKKTTTRICELNRESMISELARLIGGAKITEATLKAAAEMKQLAMSEQ